MKSKTICLKLIALTIIALFICTTSSLAATVTTVKGVEVVAKDKQAYVEWDKVSDASAYEVYVNIPGKGYTYVGKVNKNKVTIRGFSEGEEYSVKIRAYNNSNGKKVYGGFSKAVSFSFGKNEENQKIGQVKNLKATVSGTQVKLTWSKVTNASAYEVYVNIPGKGYTYVGAVSKNAVTVKGFSAGESYKIKVRAIDSNKKYGEYSNVVSFKTEGKIQIDSEQQETVKISKVTGLEKKLTGTKLKLSWDKVNNVDGYEIAVRVPGNSTYNNYKVTGTSKTLTNLSEEGTYRIKVRAYKKVNGENVYGEYSNIINVKIENEEVELGKVTGLKGKVTDSSVKLTWNKVSGADGYEISMLIPGYTTSIMTTTETSMTITQLTNTKNSYDTKVRAYKLVGGKKVYGEYSNTIDVYIKKQEAEKEDNKDVKLTKVKSLKANVTGSSVKLTWNKVNGADGYEISMLIPGYTTATMTTTETSKIVDGLTNKESSYTTKVRAYKIVNGKKVYGEYSSSVKVYAE